MAEVQDRVVHGAGGKSAVLPKMTLSAPRVAGQIVGARPARQTVIAPFAQEWVIAGAAIELGGPVRALLAEFPIRHGPSNCPCR